MADDELLDAFLSQVDAECDAATAAADDDDASKEETETDEKKDIKTAEQHKSEGNTHFSAGSFAEAEAAYSRAIEMEMAMAEPRDKLHVYFSNRSAARLRRGDEAGALADADSCIAANPLWGKGYGRKGAALFAMKKFRKAADAYQEGIALDKGNATLVEGRDKANAEALKHENNDDDDVLGAFFAEVGDLEKKHDRNQVDKRLKVTAVNHETQTSGWTRQNQLDRILARNYKFLNLNPYRCFALPTHATEEDIKKRYKKLSALVHPDKNQGNPLSHDAFEQVKKAYALLKDEGSRKVAVSIIKDCTSRVEKTRKRLLRKGLSEQDLRARDGTLEDAIDKEIKKEFARRDHMKTYAEQTARSYMAREQERNIEKQQYWRNVKETETNWREGRDKRQKTWQDFASESSAKRAKRVGGATEKMRRDEFMRHKGAGVDESYKAGWR